MKTDTVIYNPADVKMKQTFVIDKISLLSWIAVLGIIVLFWAGVGEAYKKDYVPHAIAKIEHKEKKFLAAHKAIQKKVIGIRSFV